MARMNWTRNRRTLLGHYAAAEKRALRSYVEEIEAWRRRDRQSRTVSVRCCSCGHRGYARIPRVLHQPRFRCSKCGSNITRYVR